MADQDNIIVEARDGVEIVTLNRPDSLNALSEALVAELTAYVHGLRKRPQVRVVLLRGAGRAFCAGLDIKEHRTPTAETKFQRAWRVQLELVEIIRAMRNASQPFIALGHGAACGGGFSLLMGADVRIGAPSLRMNAAYIKIGLGGADIGSSYLLPRLVGTSVAAELLLTGRFIHADRALQVGLLSSIVPEEELLDAGLALAAEMTANAPYGLALTKKVLNINIDAPSFDAAVALEDRQQVMLLHTDDHVEATTAFVEKRAPVYKGQ
ncbi:enoyl-CoA hydratase-related protein [Sphingobium sp. Sx8-8]|uniref:enoyl-CoA hydratase/isomerase family protein n=1 Tax=Sphingobium sp. Sx8-8 TaxID=2933617 RepID=UPI001F58DDAC